MGRCRRCDCCLRRIGLGDFENDIHCCRSTGRESVDRKTSRRSAHGFIRLAASLCRSFANRRPDRRAHSCDGGQTFMTLSILLVVSAALFSIGLLAALSRRHAIFILIGIEMMLAAANINFIAFWRFVPAPALPTGVMVVIFAIAIAAAEAAVGLAMVIAVYRHFRTTNVDQLNQLKG